MNISTCLYSQCSRFLFLSLSLSYLILLSPVFVVFTHFSFFFCSQPPSTTTPIHSRHATQHNTTQQHSLIHSLMHNSQTHAPSFFFFHHMQTTEIRSSLHSRALPMPSVSITLILVSTKCPMCNIGARCLFVCSYLVCIHKKYFFIHR